MSINEKNCEKVCEAEKPRAFDATENIRRRREQRTQRITYGAQMLYETADVLDEPKTPWNDLIQRYKEIYLKQSEQLINLNVHFGY